MIQDPNTATVSKGESSRIAAARKKEENIRSKYTKNNANNIYLCILGLISFFCLRKKEKKESNIAERGYQEKKKKNVMLCVFLATFFLFEKKKKKKR